MLKNNTELSIENDEPRAWFVLFTFGPIYKPQAWQVLFTLASIDVPRLSPVVRGSCNYQHSNLFELYVSGSNRFDHVRVHP